MAAIGVCRYTTAVGRRSPGGALSNLEKKSFFSFFFKFEFFIFNRRNFCQILQISRGTKYCLCLLYTSDAADDLLCVDLGGRRIIKTVGISARFSKFQGVPNIVFTASNFQIHIVNRIILTSNFIKKN